VPEGAWQNKVTDVLWPGHELLALKMTVAKHGRAADWLPFVVM
jgi:hypothetical protein